MMRKAVSLLKTVSNPPEIVVSDLVQASLDPDSVINRIYTGQ